MKIKTLIEIKWLWSTGPPTFVDVDIMVRSMGPVSEADMVKQNKNK